MTSSRKALAVLLISALFAGCGSNFEWFPNDGVFSNQSTIPPVTSPGTVVRAIPFPAAVKWASDVAFDRNSGLFWLLAGTTGTITGPPTMLVQMTPTGAFVKSFNINLGAEPIANGSALAFDGLYFWITSFGTSGGVNASQIFELLSNGTYLGNKYACLANSTGICQGIAWDSLTASLWSAASNSATLVKYQVTNGVVFATPQTFSDPFSGSSVTDVSFDNTTGEVFYIKDRVIWIKTSNGIFFSTRATLPAGTARGDWDGKNFWVVDNTSLSVKALFIR